jgi:hypothetical protein
MNTDKRPQYIWIFALLANVSMYLLLVIEAMDFEYSGLELFLVPITNYWNLAYMVLSVGVSIVPTLLSGFQTNWSRYLGYGVPIFVVLYSFWHGTTCEGKFCSLIDMPIGIAGIMFGIFYALGVSLRRRNEKIILLLVMIESLLLLGGMIFIAYRYQANSEAEAGIVSLQEVETPADAAIICESIPIDSERSSDCWVAAVRRFPDLDICAWSNEPDAKDECLFYQGIVYRENLEFGCEDEDSQLSYNKKDDPVEIARLLQCWSEKSKIYSELDICAWTYEWNDDRCYEFLGTVPQ